MILGALVAFRYVCGREIKLVPQHVVDHCFVAASTAAAIQAQEQAHDDSKEKELQAD